MGCNSAAVFCLRPSSLDFEGQAKAHGIPREEVIRDVLLAQQPNKRFATTDELGGITDIRFWHSADINLYTADVRFWAQSGRP